ncbi:MAG: tRNA 2-thiouridine(34) synthase MnmA, partial [Lachnospiraceae bacterium]|nr:tRNA 2-thiouridine(34) synthase MnmA [Lachnospiraceae bacterium]
MKKALIAMSGGVDSSLAAKMMKDAGYDCIGCTMKLYDNEDAGISRGHTCCSLDDIEDARMVAYEIGMPYYVLNFKEGFKETVINRFVNAYESGKTPNPCIDCNRFMKFEKLYQRAKEFECECVVTGHYARIEQNGDKYVLKKALDDTKDQSYVLYSMTQDQLAHTKFPLGELKKTQVREIAEKNSFINAAKPDSQDICFVPDGNYVKFLERQTGKTYTEGNFVDSQGNVLGKHKGIVGYTIGQRKGLGIAFGKPMYVTAINPADNTIVLGDHEELFGKCLVAGDFNWISGQPPEGEISCKVKIRYRQKEQPAKVRVLPDKRVQILFEEPQRAITPGQAAVLYDGDIVLGGGVIECELHRQLNYRASDLRSLR